MIDLLIHYIYVAFYPNGIPCYVGKGKDKRWLQHLIKSHNRALAGVVRKAGGNIPIIKLRENLTEAQAFEIEVALITAIGRVDLGTGPLLNLTAGGDGVVGHRRTLEQRKEMSARRKGTPVSRETAAKISAKLKNVPKTAEHGAAVSAAKKRKSTGPLSESHRKAIGDANRGGKRSPEQCAEMKARTQELQNDPIRSAKKSANISAALTGKKLSPEHCKAIGDIQRGKPKPKWSAESKKRFSDQKKGIKLGPLNPVSIAIRRAKMEAKGTAGYREKQEYRAAMRMGLLRRYDRERISEYAKWGDGASAGLL